MSTASTGERPNVALGESIGTWVRDTGLDNWNRFAAVNDEFVSIHMDDEAGRAAGMSGAFGQGNLLVSYLHGVVREWMGESGRLLRLSAQFRKPNAKGTIIAGGRITEVTSDGEGVRVELELWIRDIEGNVLAPGNAAVVLA